MHKQVRFWSVWLQAAVAVSIIAAAGLWFTSKPSASTTTDDLKLAVSELRSHSAESQLLTEQVQAHHLTSIYFNSHVAKLQEKVQTVNETLNSMAQTSDVNGDLLSARKDAGELSVALQNLSKSFDNADQLTGLKGKFEELFHQLSKLENSLKR